MLKTNLSGKRMAHTTPVRMLANDPVYSFTTLSRNFRMDATVRPPREPNNRATIKMILS